MSFKNPYLISTAVLRKNVSLTCVQYARIEIFFRALHVSEL